MMTETGLAEGQPSEGTPMETTGAGTEGTEGQSVAEDQTTIGGTGETAERTFFDPNDLSPELQNQYKEMQRAFTKKTQAYSADKHKIEAYNAFEQNPQAVLQQLAQQYGYQLMTGNQQAEQQDWEPQNWDEVTTRIKEQTRQEVLKELTPYLNEVKQLKEQTTEQYLDNTYPDWRNYQDDMMQLMTTHPTLSKDPDTLYKLAVPPEVIKSRATKEALKKLQANTQGAQVSGQSTTNKQPSKAPAGKLSFNDAVEVAKQRIQQRRA